METKFNPQQDSIICILGSRRTGKTTLSKKLVNGDSNITVFTHETSTQYKDYNVKEFNLNNIDAFYNKCVLEYKNNIYNSVIFDDIEHLLDNRYLSILMKLFCNSKRLKLKCIFNSTYHTTLKPQLRNQLDYIICLGDVDVKINETFCSEIPSDLYNAFIKNKFGKYSGIVIDTTRQELYYCNNEIEEIVDIKETEIVDIKKCNYFYNTITYITQKLGY